MAPRRALTNAVIVVVAGSLLHFTYEWSGRNPIVAVFAAVNESVWEHLKLAFWPALALGAMHRLVRRQPPGWLLATAVRTLVPPVLIVVLFYGYTALLGTHHLVLDIATFAIAVGAGEVLGQRVAAGESPREVRVAAAAAIIAAAVAFGVFSFRPPPWRLFEESTGAPEAHTGRTSNT